MPFTIEPCAIADVKILTPQRFTDPRGVFVETYSASAFADLGIDLVFMQDNQSRSTHIGTIRGLHFQSPPFAQDKLVRVIKGRIVDVAVDVRTGSPTFGRHVSVELSAEDGRQLLVPIGFAHGFVTLEPDTEVFYKVSNVYAPAHDHGLAFDDPALGIDWRLPASGRVLSAKDRTHPRLADLPACFVT